MISLLNIIYLLVGTYTIVALIFVMLCGKNVRAAYVSIERLNFLMLIALAWIGWHFYSSSYVDLVRIMEEIEVARSQGIGYLVQLYLFNPLSVVLLLPGYFTGSAQVMQLVGAIGTYGLMFIAIAKLCRLFSLSPTMMILLTDVILIMYDFGSASTNIRFPIAFWLVVIGLCQYYRRKYALAIILVLLAVITHLGVIVIPILYFVVSVLKKNYSRIIFCMLLLMYYPCMTVLVGILKSIPGRVFWEIGDRLAGYVGMTANYQNSYDAISIANGGRKSGVIYLLLAVAVFVLCLILSQISKVRLPSSKFVWFLAALLCFTAGSYDSYTFFIRFSSISTYASVLYLIYAINEYYNTYSYYGVNAGRGSGGILMSIYRSNIMFGYLLIIMIFIYIGYAMKRNVDTYWSWYMFIGIM